MGMTLTLATLTESLANHAALRRVQRLQPVGRGRRQAFPADLPAARRC